MYVRVSGDGVDVHETGDLRALSVRVDGLGYDEVVTRLVRSGLGSGAGAGHVLLDLARLRELAERPGTGPDWPDRSHRMIAYARGRGWLTPDGRCVRAHLDH
ncbi:hypothetical protein [Amycolatopsis thermoflava]|uniref:hypothetical protein n=1 Tax=Amycolatopsis thermoflava TaxID=84480 RepID=UPI003814C6FF